MGDAVSSDTGSSKPRLRVLVVDDSEDNADLLAALLEEHGHSARTANEGVKALELVEEERPNIVILDLGLPGMDGFDVACEMRRRFGDQFRIVALTGFSSAEHRERARRCGIDAYFTKPFLPAQLDALIAGTRKTRSEPQA